MTITHTIKEARAARASLGSTCLVPTMGALHQGHLSLIEAAKRAAPRVVVSIFVNPTQFGPREDFSKYPRPIEKDLQLCHEASVDLVFNPPPEEIYPPNSPEIAIDLPAFTATLEGAKRPGHFKGVCQVVAKLFNILTPDFACFGQKDYQQLRILQAMTQALDFPIEIIACPTLREPDGLAMSSRNVYLSKEERQRALAISKALKAAEEQVGQGYRSTARLITTMQKMLLDQHLLVDYVAAVDATTLKAVQEVAGPTLLAIAAHVGGTRLIDNTVVEAAR
jgi:pantoate--beta-alanine ligase